MEMITQDEVNIQETLKNVLRKIPAVITRDTEAYILVKDISQELDEFIKTGKAGVEILNVFSEAQEKELTANWKENGYTYSFHLQPFEYKHKRISIRYPAVSNTRINISVSLIPWCMLPGRLYPVFVYAYADWHYSKTGQKSMMASARATGKIFGVESFNKSTLSRIRKDKSISGVHTDDPEVIGGQAALQYIDAVARAAELLECPEPTPDVYETDRSEQRSPPVSYTEFTTYELRTVPFELSKVIKDNPPAPRRFQNTRKRPPRLRHRNKTECVQRFVRFEDSDRIEYIRMTFITLCKAAVVDAAVKYHRFLI